MPKTKHRPAVRTAKTDTDGAYLLKLVLYLMIGSQWLWLLHPNGGSSLRIPLPLGLLVGLVFAWHDHFRIDRKIEYAVLLVAMLVGFVTQVGFSIYV